MSWGNRYMCVSVDGTRKGWMEKGGFRRVEDESRNLHDRYCNTKFMRIGAGLSCFFCFISWGLLRYLILWLTPFP
jgi:hypothetical protein